MNETKNEGYVSSTVIKNYFSIPKSSFELLVKQGMPHIRIGAVRRFRLLEVESWLIARGDEMKQLKDKRHAAKALQGIIPD
jgi:hypothetical protein